MHCSNVTSANNSNVSIEPGAVCNLVLNSTILFSAHSEDRTFNMTGRISISEPTAQLDRNLGADSDVLKSFCTVKLILNFLILSGVTSDTLLQEFQTLHQLLRVGECRHFVAFEHVDCLL